MTTRRAASALSSSPGRGSGRRPTRWWRPSRSITRRKDPSEPGGWESYQHSLIPRAAADDIGRVVKLFDSLVGMLPWHAVQPSEAARILVEVRYAPAQATLLAAEALRRA